jgi:hypothetical protein
MARAVPPAQPTGPRRTGTRARMQPGHWMDRGWSPYFVRCLKLTPASHVKLLTSATTLLGLGLLDRTLLY